MTQTFIDTLVVCSFTGLAIIATGAWSTGADGAGLTQIPSGPARLATEAGRSSSTRSRCSRSRRCWAGPTTASLPLPQGTDSTTTPHLGQSTRRMAYTQNTAIPHRGDELETPRHKRVVTGSRAGASRAYRPRVAPGSKLHVQRDPPPLFTQVRRSVDEGLVLPDPVEDSLQLHPVGGHGVDGFFARHIVPQTPQDAPPPTRPPLRGLPQAVKSPTDSAEEPENLDATRGSPLTRRPS